MKKLLLSTGIAVASIAPLATVVSCSSSEHKTWNQEFEIPKNTEVLGDPHVLQFLDKVSKKLFFNEDGKPKPEEEAKEIAKNLKLKVTVIDGILVDESGKKELNKGESFEATLATAGQVENWRAKEVEGKNFTTINVEVVYSK